MDRIIRMRVAVDNKRDKALLRQPLFGALILSVVLKASLLAAGVVPFNSDEAVVALMARHILQGERPVFFYGQAYLGSLDAWLVAGAFAMLGESVTAIRVVQVILYLGTIATCYWLALRIYRNRWIAAVAALLLAIPAVTATLYTTATLGGYGETLLIGNGLLLLALRIGEGSEAWWHWLLFGLLAGIGFWGFGLVLVYLVPALLYIAALRARRWVGSQLEGKEPQRHEDTKPAKFSFVPSWPRGNLSVRLALAAIAFVLGAWPWIGFTLANGLLGVKELGGSAIGGASGGGLVAETGKHLLNFVVLGTMVIFGLRPSWSVRLLALPLAPLALTVQLAAVTYAVRRLVAHPNQQSAISDSRFAIRNLQSARWLLAGVCLTLIAAFLFTPFGADPSGRYFVPLAVPLAIFTAEMFYRVRRDYPRLAVVGIVSLVAFNLWGTIQSAVTFPPGLTTQFDPVAQIDHRYDAALVNFLLAEGETRGYGNYWVEFPIAFLSQERLLFSSQLPYHLDFRYTSRDDRYPAYTEAVAASERVAYITSKHPALGKRIRGGLMALGVEFRESEIGDYHVFYRLSRKVVPEELWLGVERCPN
ncbi:MAG: glycosyltransferase family 39 protein [Chloroflexi bacterium]|nr:glycosyltransferase family 39 protein [Chloroflexota bacterium]